MAATSSINVLQLVRRVLLADPLVSDTVADRVLTGHRFDASQGTLPMPAIILAAQGGSGMSNKAKQSLIFHLYAYSDVGEGEALDLYAAAFDALCSSRLYNEHVSTAGYCYENERPRHGYNDRLIAWWARGTWTAQAAG